MNKKTAIQEIDLQKGGIVTGFDEFVLNKDKVLKNIELIKNIRDRTISTYTVSSGNVIKVDVDV